MGGYRIGSTWLASLLDAHPHVRCGLEGAGESLDPWYNSSAVVLPDQVLSPGNAQALGSFRALDHWCSRQQRERGPFAAVGRKLGAMEFPVHWWAHMRTYGYRAVCYMRANLVKHYVSHLRTKRLRAVCGLKGGGRSFSNYSCANRPDLRLTRLEPAALRKKLEVTERRLAKFCHMCRAYSHAVPVYLLAYERLLHAMDEEGPRLLRFLGAPQRPLALPAPTAAARSIAGATPASAGAVTGAGMRKLTSADLRAQVSNFEEVQTTLAGTEFARMLEPDWMPPCKVDLEREAQLAKWVKGSRPGKRRGTGRRSRSKLSDGEHPEVAVP